MHGFNQGIPTLHDIIVSHAPDVILLQEHWFTSANLPQLVSFQGYFSFGLSAMNHVVEAGVLRGRPYGGVAVLINEHLPVRPVTYHAAVVVGSLLLRAAPVTTGSCRPV